MLFSTLDFFLNTGKRIMLLTVCQLISANFIPISNRHCEQRTWHYRPRVNFVCWVFMTETQPGLRKKCPWEPAEVGFVPDGLFGGLANASWIYFSGCP